MGSFANGDKQVYSVRVGTQMSIVSGKKSTKIQVSIGFKVPVVFAVCLFLLLLFYFQCSMLDAVLSSFAVCSLFYFTVS